MRDHRNFWLKSIGAACFVIAAVTIVPDLAAQRFGGNSTAQFDSPVDEDSSRHVQARLRQPGVTAIASRTVAQAQATGHAQMLAEIEGEALERAHRAFIEQRFEDTQRLCEALISRRSEQLADEDGDPEALQSELDRARILLANVHVQAERYDEAARALAAVSADTPINDFVDWLHGRALMRAGEPAEAAAAFERAWQRDTTLVKPRARVEQAHALAAAEQWSEALVVLEEVIDDFPDYPRRHRALFQRAQALEALDRLDEAAEAYQQTWFEFPHKPEGEQARSEMRRLAEQGYEVSEIPRDDLYDRYRQLRINKHWPLAKRLFLELLEDNQTESGHSRFEHEILMQLALNDYVPQHYEDALGWLEKLRRAYESGHTDGINKNLTYKYLSFTHSQLGQLDKALEAIEKRTEGRGSYAQRGAKAEFFEEHGFYTRARELYDTFYSDWRKRGWHYTWLLYKSGEFQDAYENLTRLAERSSGQRRAKYMYWAARTLDRGGKLDEAVELYSDVADAYDLNYYGIQAKNRMVDIRQRQAVDGALLTHAQGIVKGGDEAIAAMDDAAEVLADRDAVAPYRDPRMVPRTGEEPPAAPPEEAAELSRLKCEAESVEDQKFCQLMAGQMPGEGRQALQMALAPIQPYAGLLSTGLPLVSPEELTEASFDDDDPEDRLELGDQAGTDAPAPRRDVELADLTSQVPRVQYNTEARIYWEGRSDSPIAFVKADEGKVIGPLPDKPWAYDQTDYHDGLERAVDEAGELFPQLVRAQWLRQSGHLKYARWAMRDAAIEYRGLSSRSRPRSKPHELPEGRWDHLIDNRRREKGLWGLRSSQKRYPVPSSSAEREELLERQQAIYERRGELDSLMLDAMKDVGDYHMVRRETLGTGPWYRKSPTGPMRYKWMQAYPRAFPRQVLEGSQKSGVNPYLLWALMTVESSYNPDSISPADALGLLQVIPRTGIKTAQMLGDEDFGPFDLIDEDVALQHGAFYFGKLVDKFHGQELLAIAGYNGGPHRVAGWVKKRGRNMPMDEFVEEIPFNEARGYTKKVIRFLSLYLRIYEGIDHLYVGQNMRLDYLPDPNF
ncbi:MAG: transglycosylase SLT domain-containing protein [Persicimonas sp.]